MNISPPRELLLLIVLVIPEQAQMEFSCTRRIQFFAMGDLLKRVFNESFSNLLERFIWAYLCKDLFEVNSITNAVSQTD